MTELEDTRGLAPPPLRSVAVLGVRYENLAIEEEVLGPLGVRLEQGEGASADEIIAIAGEAAVILLGSSPRLDAALLPRLRCRGIVRYGVGTERIDLDAAKAAGIWVARVSDYGTEAVSTHTVMLALAAIRRLGEAHTRVRDGGWGFADLRPLHLPSTLTAGVIGYGRIGRATARLLGAFGFRVLVSDPFVSVDDGDVEQRPLEELLRVADVVCLHAPGLPSDKPLLDARVLALLREGSVLVNTARGSLIDENALAAGLARGRPRIAALDVFPDEPPSLAPFASVLDRMILTPHMAWYTEESERDLRRRAAEEACRLLAGERPLDVVVEPAVEKDRGSP